MIAKLDLIYYNKIHNLWRRLSANNAQIFRQDNIFCLDDMLRWIHISFTTMQ